MSFIEELVINIIFGVIPNRIEGITACLEPKLSLIVGQATERPSAEQGSLSADYDIYGLTWMRRIKILNAKGYKKTKDYKKSLFVPSIVFGAAWEQKSCDSANARCADGILRANAVTPFVGRLGPRPASS